MKERMSISTVLTTTVIALGVVACLSPAAHGQVWEWLLDEGTGATAYDTGGSGQDGTLVGDATWISPGADGSPYALHFDGQSNNEDYVDFGTGLLGGPPFDELVAELWVRVDTANRPPDYPPHEKSVAFGNETTDGEFNIGFISDLTDPDYGRAFALVRATGGAGSTVLVGSQIADGLWHHLRIEMASDETRFYVDGSLRDSAPSWGPLQVIGTWKVAIGGKYTDDLGNKWFGDIDGVRVFATADEKPRCLLAEWVLDECSGSTAYDTSCGGHDGTLVGDAAWISPGAEGSGCALHFDGQSNNEDYVDFGRSLLGGPTFYELVTELYVRVDTANRPPDYPPHEKSVAFGDETADGEFNIGFISDLTDPDYGRAFALVRATGGAGPAVLVGSPIADGLWHHIRIEMTSTGTRMYVDGPLRDSAPSWGPLQVIGTWRVAIGGKYTDDLGNKWFGDIDEVRVWGTPGCPGDLTGDGFRNVTDFTLFAAAYGSQCGDQDYNCAADLNVDGFINVTDFTQFAAVYGVPCP